MEISRFRTCRYVLCFSDVKATTKVDARRSLSITLFRAFVRIMISGFLFAAVFRGVEGPPSRHPLKKIGVRNINSRRQSFDYFQNQFAVKVAGGPQEVNRIAHAHGFTIINKIGSLENYYLLEHHSVQKRSLYPSQLYHSLLKKEPTVEWVEQQVELKRETRDLIHNFKHFFHKKRKPRITSPSFMENLLSSSMKSDPSISSQSMDTAFPDPMYGDQWYLNVGAIGGYDMNVQGVWRKGITGKGVVVSVVDDGIQTNHPDLIQNYDPLASIDVIDNNESPMPKEDKKHGTRCAGEIAATAYNEICGVGIAYNARLGGIRLLDPTMNDAAEARALSHKPDHIDIYNNSWGPLDDGLTLKGPGTLARKAFLDGVTKGRRGKGSIYIWAAGNGGHNDDDCNCDGYASSIYTISVSSTTQHGLKPWYGEHCSSTLATTYSGGTLGHDLSIATVDLDMTFDKKLMCTLEFSGTSASAPMASAICALALEANLHLTWRDMQYLVVLTSNPQPISEEAGWVTNGVNRKVSHKFGFGLMNATALVTLAEHWRSVPPQHICEMPLDNTKRLIPNEFGASVEFYLDTDGCYGTRRVVNYLEHVQARISLKYKPRGNLKIILQSPYHTSSTLLHPRSKDMLTASFDDWHFLSVHFWGERPAGHWRLKIINSGTEPVLHPGVLKSWSLVFYGTGMNPIQKNMTSITSMDFKQIAKKIIVFVSPKSGENQGKSLMEKLYRILPNNNVFTVDGGNQPIDKLSNIMAKDEMGLSDKRILICGDDGTANWVMSDLAKILTTNEMPPIAILPLGTGNHLTRLLGWGAKYYKEPICDILADVFGESYLLDRWHIEFSPTPDESEPETVATESEPETVAAESEPKTVATEWEPENVATESEPETVATESEPQTVATDSEPESVAPEYEPQTVATESEPETVATQSEPETVATESEPETVAIEAEPETVATESEPEAVATESEPETVATESEPETVAIESEPETVATESNDVCKAPFNIFNNYFSMGMDAEIALKFDKQKKAHPFLHQSQHVNKIWYGLHGIQSIVKHQAKKKTNVKLNEIIDCIMCDNIRICPELGKYVTIIFLNIPSYSTGKNPWSPKGNFQTQRMDDMKIEVMGFKVKHVIGVPFGKHGTSIAQCGEIEFTTKHAITVQVDGDGCIMPPSTIRITLEGQAPVVKRRKGEKPSKNMMHIRNACKDISTSN